MSRQVNTYIMFGALLDFGAVSTKFGEDAAYELLGPYLDDAFKAAVNPKDGLTCLYDGMDGEYIAIGHVVAKSENHQQFGRPHCLNRDDVPLYAVVALTDLVTALAVPPKCPPGWMVISHHR